MDTSTEVWKDVVGFEDTHMISSAGNIRVKGRYLNNNGTSVWMPEHDIKPFRTNIGYVQVNLNIAGKQYKKYVHRLVAEAFIENPNGLKEVDHIDCNKTNNHVHNLQWIDHRSNVRRILRSTKAKRVEAYQPRLTKRPPKHVLLSSILRHRGNFVQLAKAFAVTDNAVRKWCRYYQLPFHSYDYKMGA